MAQLLDAEFGHGPKQFKTFIKNVRKNLGKILANKEKMFKNKLDDQNSATHRVFKFQEVLAQTIGQGFDGIENKKFN